MKYEPAHYRIGGRITEDQLKRLEELIKRIENNWVHIWEFNVASDCEGKKFLAISSDDTQGGSLRDLEAFLQEEGIPYDHLVDDGTYYFRPGMKEPYFIGDPQHHPQIVTIDDLEEIISETTGRDDLIEKLRK